MQVTHLLVQRAIISNKSLITRTSKPPSLIIIAVPPGRSCPALVGAKGKGAVGSRKCWGAKTLSRNTPTMVWAVMWTVRHRIFGFEPGQNIICIGVEKNEQSPRRCKHFWWKSLKEMIIHCWDDTKLVIRGESLSWSWSVNHSVGRSQGRSVARSLTL